MGNRAAKSKYFNKKCYLCGREFYAGGQYVYKRNYPTGHVKFFCSYSCVRDFDRSREERRNKQRNAEK